MQIKLKRLSFAISLMALSFSTQAQVQTLKEVTSGVQSLKFSQRHAFQSTASSRDAASGAYLPSVNLNADAGRDTATPLWQD